MKPSIHIICISLIFLLDSCGWKKNNYEQDWISLFNGKDLNDWIVKIHHHEVGDNYANTFRVNNGVIQVNYDGYKTFNDRFGHLFYKEPFSSYQLKFKYRFTNQWMDDAPGFAYRNSGVMFHSQDPKSILKEQDWPISVEFQMLAATENEKDRPTGNMCSPGTEVFYKNEMDPRHCIQSSSPTFNYDDWVNGELIVYGDSLVIHKINGEKVLEYNHPQIGGGVVNGFDPAIKVDGKLLSDGYIALQAEGQGVEFKDIKIKKMSEISEHTSF
ncbi:DUF1080 domain-containing protein [Arenibacter sp. ARW7G5Y1]|uniref:3-keto-disaccharide hydrolase n=1 Tax=Arenibacter sp. ARW7G5Y1 TaxID=2135619 RepID=UPI000D8A3B0F|nr:DUF1080 domain-containing protein [Arenibacter sp. ARW7G5Y1]PXX21708.1 uncharacterized protein DUF1080 [Arenibacter sp. ARW7G5Y1]